MIGITASGFNIFTNTATNIVPPPSPNEADIADVKKLTTQRIIKLMLETSGVLDIISKIKDIYNLSKFLAPNQNHSYH